MLGTYQGILGIKKKKKNEIQCSYLMISPSSNRLKVVFRYGLQLYRINVEQVFFLAYINSLALVLLGDG